MSRPAGFRFESLTLTSFCAAFVLCVTPATAQSLEYREDGTVRVHPWRTDQIQRRSVEHPPRLSEFDINLLHAVPTMLAGDPRGSPPDTSADRIDPNLPASPYAGVCSVNLGGGALCTGAVISPHHVITAAHCVDFDSDGDNELTTFLFITLNHDGDASLVIPPSGIEAVTIHPEFTGFGMPVVNDDLVIIRLKDPLPPGIPIYTPYRGEVRAGQEIHLAGYGTTGDGVSGLITGSATTTIKRTGRNVTETFFTDDDNVASEVIELWQYDFDGPDETTNCLGGLTLGNDIETATGPGDSGSSILIDVGDGALQMWGSTTGRTPCPAFGQQWVFGSLGFGQVGNGYLPWIDLILECENDCTDCNDNGIPDGIDLAEGVSTDRNANGVLDECEAPAGDIWISSTIGNQRYRFSGTDGSLLDDYQAFNSVNSMRVLDDGLAYAPSLFGNMLMRFDPVTGDFIDIFIPPGAGLAGPSDVTVGDDGLLYVLNRGPVPGAPGSAFISRHDLVTGELLDIFMSDDPATPAIDETGGIPATEFLQFGPDGHLYATAQGTAMYRYDGKTGALIDRFITDDPATPGVDESGGLSSGQQFIFHDDGLLYVASQNTNSVLTFDAATGAFAGAFVNTAAVGLFAPHGLAFRDGLLYVVGFASNNVWQFDEATGAPIQHLITASAGLNGATSILFVPDAGQSALPGDLDGDGHVDFSDLLALLAAWGPCADCPEDLDDSNDVGFSDLLILLSNWG